MTEDRDELLREIGAALSIEPTPEFVAKVRTAVARERMVPWGRGYMVTAAAAAMVFLVAVGAFTIRREAPDPVAVFAPSASPPLAGLPAAMPGDVLPTSDRSASRRTLRRPVEMRSRSVIVAANEVEAFWRLVAAVRADDVTIPPARWVVSQATGELEPLPEIAAIELPPVTIDPLPLVEVDDKVGGTNE